MQNQTVVIADDHPLIIQGLKEMLAEASYHSRALIDLCRERGAMAYVIKINDLHRHTAVTFSKNSTQRQYFQQHVAVSLCQRTRHYLN